MPHNEAFSQEQVRFLIEKAREYALDIERHSRQESSQSQLSPTDLAFFSRLVMFLRYEIAEDLTGDPEAFPENL